MEPMRVHWSWRLQMSERIMRSRSFFHFIPLDSMGVGYEEWMNTILRKYILLIPLESIGVGGVDGVGGDRTVIFIHKDSLIKRLEI